MYLKVERVKTFYFDLVRIFNSKDKYGKWIAITSVEYNRKRDGMPRSIVRKLDKLFNTYEEGQGEVHWTQVEIDVLIELDFPVVGWS